MEKIVQELRKIFVFKDTTEAGDIVLVVSEDPQMVLYAQIMEFERDTSKRDEWWHVTFQFFTLPPQRVVWTLRTQQFSGQEIFTMGGKKKFIQAVNFHGDSPPAEEAPPKKGTRKKSGLRLVK